MNTSYISERLNIRIATRRDAGMILDFYQKNFEEFARYELLDRKTCRKLSFFQKLIELDEEAFEDERSFRFYVFDKKFPLEVLGTISFRNIQYGARQSCEIGYKIDRDYRRLGLASEVISLMTSMVHMECGLHRFEATVHIENEPSMALLESLGFVREGTLREFAYLNGRWWDHHIYSKLL